MASLFGALFVLMAAGGLIAYLGDQLGYKMGKRRISLFGLRPRHAATAATVLGGVLIAAATFGALLAVNTSFRTALVEGPVLLEKNYRLRADNTHLQVQATRAQSTAALAVQNAAAAQTAAVSARSEAALAVSHLQAAQKSLSAASLQAKTAQGQVAQQKALLQAIAVKVTAEAQEVASENAQVASARSHLAVLQAHKQQELEEYLKSFGLSHSSPVVYHADDELGRTVIQAAQPEQRIRDSVVQFLFNLSGTALAQGAARGENGRAVEVSTVAIEPTLPGDSHARPTFFNEAQSIDALASQIHAYGQGSVVIVASALGNQFGGKPVIIRLHPYANKLVFHAGALLASTTIDGSGLTFDQIVAQFQIFLVGQLRPAAMRAGVIPVRDPDEHRFELGDVSLDQLDDVVRQIQAIGGPAQIVASVQKDTYAGDPLHVAFQVRTSADSPEQPANGQ